MPSSTSVAGSPPPPRTEELGSDQGTPAGSVAVPPGMASPADGAYQIFVKTPTGYSTILLWVTASESVFSVKTKVAAKVGFPAEVQRLIYGGRQLEDDKSLSDFSVGQEATLHLALRIGGRPRSPRTSAKQGPAQLAVTIVQNGLTEHVMLTPTRNPSAGERARELLAREHEVAVFRARLASARAARRPNADMACPATGAEVARSASEDVSESCTICSDHDGQPSCPICLDSLVAPQMLGCGHVYCATCIVTHASVQWAANRPVNCPCCLRPVAPAELPTEVHVEAAETAASSSTVEAPALSQQEQRAFRRAAKRLDLRLCPSCDAPVQKNGGCNHIRCRCGADFQWSRAKPVAKKSRTCRYAKQGAKVVGKAAVGVVAAPVVVAGAAVAGTAVLVYCVGTILAGGRLWDGTCR